MKDLIQKTIITIISIVIATVVGQFFNIEPIGLFYIAITCVIITHVDFDKLIENAKNRGFGTLIGGIIGIIFSYIPLPLILKIIIGEFIIILFCEKKLKIPSAIASVVFLIIIYRITSEAPYLYGFKRVLDTFIGIIITVIITYIFKKLNILK